MTTGEWGWGDEVREPDRWNEKILKTGGKTERPPLWQININHITILISTWLAHKIQHCVACNMLTALNVSLSLYAQRNRATVMACLGRLAGLLFLFQYTCMAKELTYWWTSCGLRDNRWQYALVHLIRIGALLLHHTSFLIFLYVFCPKGLSVHTRFTGASLS